MIETEKTTDEHLKREHTFDNYGRYAIIRDIINTNRKAGERFKVLDVGGRGNIMRKFLPNDDVFYLDPHVKTEDDNYIEGDGCEIPLEDGAFDFVVSADVFEHIPEEKRVQFLEENIRVARLGVILAAPFYSEAVYQAEVSANEGYKVFSGGDSHIYLKEHIANGLPKERELEWFLKEKGYDYQKLNNNNLMLWEYLIAVVLIATNNPYGGDTIEDLYKFNYLYNKNNFPHDFSSPSYRKIYFIKKKDLANLEVSNEPIDGTQFSETIRASMGLINKIVGTNRAIIQERDRELAHLNSEVAHLNNEIGYMKGSKFWKLRDFCWKIRDSLPKQR